VVFSVARLGRQRAAELNVGIGAVDLGRVRGGCFRDEATNYCTQGRAYSAANGNTMPTELHQFLLSVRVRETPSRMGESMTSETEGASGIPVVVTRVWKSVNVRFRNRGSADRTPFQTFHSLTRKKGWGGNLAGAERSLSRRDHFIQDGARSPEAHKAWWREIHS
jgi:hypothetical protein